MVIAMKSIRMIFCSLGILLFSCILAQGGELGGQNDNTEKAVAYLLDHVAQSHLTFIRNGTEYSSQEAAEHMRHKYEYFKSRIKSLEDFIRHCASKSLVSGEPYLVLTTQGNIPVEKWLGEALIAHGKRQHLF
jgi:hypothetical protein